MDAPNCLGFGLTQIYFINSYGEKPNSELLFIHGFTIPENIYDSIMFQAPILESTQEEVTPEDEFTIRSKLAFIRFLGLKPIVLLHPQSPTTISETSEGSLSNPTMNGLDMDSLLVMLISVMTADDGLAPIPRNLSASSIKKQPPNKHDVNQSLSLSPQPMYMVGGEEISCREALVKFISAHPLKDVLMLRAFTILQSVVQERFIEMNEMGDEENGISDMEASSKEDLQQEETSGQAQGVKLMKAAEKTVSQRAIFVGVLRDGHFKLLLEALEWLGSLQIEFAERESVLKYLQSMQLQDEGVAEGEESVN
jgi:hypothetical protein